ncbi:unnamed protein product [Alopecurus aequalis]
MAVPASLLVSSGLLVVATAYTPIGCVVTFLVSYLFLERILRPEAVDDVFRVFEDLLLQDLRHLRNGIRDDPLAGNIYAAAEEHLRRARSFVANATDSLETKAEAQLSGVKDAAVAAFLWLRLAAGVANVLATALMNAAFQEARSRAPSVLRLKGVKGLRASPPNEEEAAPVCKPGTTLLVVWIAAIVAYSSIGLFGRCFPCFAALCGFTLMEAERVYLWGSYAIDTATGKPKRRAGDAAGGAKEKEDLRDAWEYLSSLTILMHCIDACFVVLALGSQPFMIVRMAIYNGFSLNETRQAYLKADDADEAHGGNVSKWRRAALNMLEIDIVKVVTTYLVVDFYLGMILFSALCVKMVICLAWEIYLSEEGASGDNDDTQQGAGPAGLAGDVAGSGQGTGHDNQDDAGFAGDVARDTEGSDDDNHHEAGLPGDVAEDAEASDNDNHDGAGLPGDVAGDAEGSVDVRAENSSDIAACDHEEEEGEDTEEHSDISDSEQHRREELDYSSSSSMDDWSLVGVDPMMPTNVNGGVDRKFRFFT